MNDLVQRLRQPSDFYFTDQMTAKKANALYTSLLQDGADAIEALETKCAMQKGLIDGFVVVNNRLEAENAALKTLIEALHKQKPVAWAMTFDGGEFIDAICPKEHGRREGQYTVPLYAAPGAKP